MIVTETVMTNTNTGTTVKIVHHQSSFCVRVDVKTACGIFRSYITQGLDQVEETAERLLDENNLGFDPNDIVDSSIYRTNETGAMSEYLTELSPAHGVVVAIRAARAEDVKQ